MVDGEPEDLGAVGTGGDVVLLVAGDRGYCKALGIMVGTLAVAVDNVLDGALVAAVEYAGIEEVCPEESLVRHLRNTEFTILADYDDFAQV